MKAFILKTLIVAVCLVSCHSIYILFFYFLKNGLDENLIPAVLSVYASLLLYAGIFYFLFAAVYLKLHTNNLVQDTGIALLLTAIAYFIARVPDMIDGDFIENTDLYSLSFMAPTITGFLLGGKLSNKVGYRIMQ